MIGAACEKVVYLLVEAFRDIDANPRRSSQMPTSSSKRFGAVPVYRRCEEQLACPEPLQHGRLFRVTPQCSSDQEGGRVENGCSLIHGPSRVWSSAVFPFPVPIATPGRAS